MSESSASPQTPAQPSEVLARATAALQDLFGYPSFRDAQAPVVEAVLNNEHLLVVMPTGAGKSLIYQLPALVRRGLTIVVSPLIALMKDQVDQLAQRGLGAHVATINSTQSMEEQFAIIDRIAQGDVRLVYVAPERFQSRSFMEAIAQVQVRLFAIDEAHCISQWGHDFRPDYTRLRRVREQLQPRQVLALTATATEKVRVDICEQLGEDLRTVVAGFRRHNLFFEVRYAARKVEKIKAVQQVWREMGRFGIVYCATRRNVENVYEALRDAGLRATLYHGGMNDDERRDNQEAFQRGDVDVIVATNAFGMGVDKPDVRFIVHYDIPGSVEAYYQEAGRAGRDGEPSRCVLLYSPHDLRVQEMFLEGENPTPAAIREVWQKLLNVPGDVIEQTRAEMAEGLTQISSEYAVSTVLKHLAKAGYLRRLFDHQATAGFRLTGNPRGALRGTKGELYRFLNEQPAARVTGVNHDLDMLAEQFGVKTETLRNAIRGLEEAKILGYEPPFRGRAVKVEEAVPADELALDWDGLETKRTAARSRLDRMVAYAELPVCRHTALLRYFGEETDDCGNACDVCTGIVRAAPRRKDTPAATTYSSGPVELSPRAASVALDVLKLAQKLKGTFGSRRLSQILGGSEDAQLQQWNLTRFPEHGRYAELSQDRLNDAVDALIHAGLLELYKKSNGDRFKRCRLSERGEECLVRREASMLPCVPQVALLDAGMHAAPAADAGNDRGATVAAPDPDAVRRLKDLRSRLAKRDSVPGYRVLTNKALDGIAARKPQNFSDLLEVTGVGSATVDTYGQDILEAVNGAAPGTARPPLPKRERKWEQAPERPDRLQKADGVRKKAKPKPSDHVSREVIVPGGREPESLYDVLRETRRTLAKDADISPSRIVGNRSLRVMASMRPADVDALRQVEGVSDDMADRFGDAFVKAIGAWDGGSDPPATAGVEQPAPQPRVRIREAADAPASSTEAAPAEPSPEQPALRVVPPEPEPEAAPTRSGYRSDSVVDTGFGPVALRAVPRDGEPGPVPPADATRADDLIDRLRAFRREASRAVGVPQHRIATDPALRAIAAARPRTLRELVHVNGLARLTVQDYGEAIVHVVARSLNGDPPDTAAALATLDATPTATAATPPTAPAAEATPDDAKVLALLTFGRTPAEIARATATPLPAVCEQIERLIAAGYHVDPAVLLDGPLRDAAGKLPTGDAAPSAATLATDYPDEPPHEHRLLATWLAHATGR